MKDTANPNKLAYIGAKPGDNRDSDSWFTPAKYIEMARNVMGSIDIDPFTSIEANKIVKAKRIFTVENSAFSQDWNTVGRATVWMNPPYGRGLINSAINKLIEEYYKGGISQAIILINNTTETQAFQSLASEASAICLVEKRIAFYTADDKEVSGNTRGQVFLYLNALGSEAFENEFKKIGLVFSK